MIPDEPLGVQLDRRRLARHSNRGVGYTFGIGADGIAYLYLLSADR